MRYLLVLLLLVGCAREKRGWYRDGATEEDFYRDRGQCVAQASAAPFGPMSDQALLIMGGCMQGKGWYMKPIPQ